jgi:hypothetical protein
VATSRGKKLLVIHWFLVIQHPTMVSSRGEDRKRQNSHSGDEPSDLLLDPSEAEAALEEAEATLSRKNKKKRLESFERTHPPLELIPPEVLTHIMSYMDDSKDIYNFAKCSKHIRDAVTPEVVIRSAVFAGGKTRKAIQDVMTHVQNKAIHVPSTFRILRLVNGKQCERLESCFGYNLLTRKAEDVSRSGIRPFGLCICTGCTNGLSHRVFHYSHKISRVDILAKHNLTSLLCHPQFEASIGAAIGPIVICEKVKQIMCTYSKDEDQLAALQRIHTELTENSPEEYRQDLVDIYLNAESEYDAFEQGRRKIELEKSLAKISVRATKKQEKVRAILGELEEKLSGYKHKVLALSGEYDRYGFYKLTLGPSQVVLGKLLGPPSSKSQKKIQEACADIREVYDLLEEFGFLGTGSDFLRDFPSVCGSAHIEALVRFCKKSRDFETLLGYKYEDYVDFVALLRGGEIHAALVKIFRNLELAQAFADYVARSETDEVLRGKCRRLAVELWPRRTMNSLEDYPGEFDSKRREYAQLCQNFKDYLRHPRTVAFLAETRPAPAFAAFSRQDAIDTLLKLDSFQRQRLLDRNFSLLLSHHRHCFNAGRYIPRGALSRW